MKLNVKKAGSWLGILSIILGLGLTSCKKKGDEPNLPPEASMIMDFSDFGGSNKTLDSTATWGYSAINVLAWNVVLYVNLAVPTAAFRESFNHTPKWDRKAEAWIWSYDYNWIVKYSMQLHGWVADGKAHWEMHISQAGGFQDVIWFTGTSELDNSSGSWLLNKDGNDPKSYISINWNKVSSTNMDITFTNVLAGDPNMGDYIHAGVMDSLPKFDRFYEIYHAATSNMTTINWHHLNQNGRVKDPAHFSDTNWHCWDEFHVDAICL